jgi:tetratricopeptide (TPR) repeat protein
MRECARLAALLVAFLVFISGAQAAAELNAARATFEQGDFVGAAEEARATETAEGLAFAARALLVHADLVARGDDRLPLIERAEEDARAAIALAPEYAEGHLQLAVALGFKARLEGRLTAHAAGYADEARAHLDYVAAREPDNPWLHALLGGWHLEISEVGGFLGRTIYGAEIDAGVDAYDQALSLKPDDLLIVYQCALQLAALGDEPLITRARALLQQATLPEDPDALDRLIFERISELKEALASNNAVIIDAVVRTQKGEGVSPDGSSGRHQIRPPIGSPR